jgi:transcriptional regulator with XRE-family HTH domain
MSYFGRNIKKIRAAKNISQTVFGELFGLTRASIGAYEEGRAEAKIDTIIEITEYFHLTLDQFLKKDLTLNEIYKIGEKSKQIQFSDNVRQTQIEIPFIKISEQIEFVKKFNNHAYFQGLQNIKLPDLLKDSIAFEFSDSLEPTLYSGLRSGDMLIAQKILPDKIDQIVKNQIFVVLTNDELFLSRIDTNLSGKIIFTEKVLDIHDKSIKAIWSVYQIISSKIPLSDQVELRLQNIESQLNKLLSK